MSDYFWILTCAAISFVLGFLPLYKVAVDVYDSITFKIVRSRKYERLQTFSLPFLIVPVLIILLDALKGVAAIMIVDTLLGRSDMSLVIAVSFALSGNFLSTYIFSKKRTSNFLIWGIFFYLNIPVTLVVVFIGIIVLVFSNRVLSQLSMGMIFLIYYLFLDYPVSYAFYALEVVFYIVMMYYAVFRDLRKLLRHELSGLVSRG